MVIDISTTTFVYLVLLSCGIGFLAYRGTFIKFFLKWKDQILIGLTFTKDLGLVSDKKTSENSEFPYCFLKSENIIRIHYGEEADTECERNLTIKALTHDVNYLQLYNASPDIEIKAQKGFIHNDEDFVMLRKLPSWDGTLGSGVFSNLHAVFFQFPHILKNNSHKVSIILKAKGHYMELQKFSDQWTHFSYLLTLANSTNNNFTFYLPKGEISRVFKIKLIQELKADILFEKEFDFKKVKLNKPVDLENNNGVIVVSDAKECWKIEWSIASEIKAGTVCKLQWFTIRK